MPWPPDPVHHVGDEIGAQLDRSQHGHHVVLGETAARHGPAGSARRTRRSGARRARGAGRRRPSSGRTRPSGRSARIDGTRRRPPAWRSRPSSRCARSCPHHQPGYQPRRRRGRGQSDRPAPGATGRRPRPPPATAVGRRPGLGGRSRSSPAGRVAHQLRHHVVGLGRSAPPPSGGPAGPAPGRCGSVDGLVEVVGSDQRPRRRPAARSSPKSDRLQPVAPPPRAGGWPAGAPRARVGTRGRTARVRPVSRPRRPPGPARRIPLGPGSPRSSGSRTQDSSAAGGAPRRPPTASRPPPARPGRTGPSLRSARAARGAAGSSRHRSATCIRYWSRTRSSGCSATAARAVSAALARPSGVPRSAAPRIRSTRKLEERLGLARWRPRRASGSVRARSAGIGAGAAGRPPPRRPRAGAPTRRSGRRRPGRRRRRRRPARPGVAKFRSSLKCSSARAVPQVATARATPAPKKPMTSVYPSHTTTSPRRDDVLLGPVEAVERPALGVDRRLGGVLVLGRVRAARAATRPPRATGWPDGIEDGEEDPGPEGVLQPAPPVDEPEPGRRPPCSSAQLEGRRRARPSRRAPSRAGTGAPPRRRSRGCAGSRGPGRRRGRSAAARGTSRWPAPWRRGATLRRWLSRPAPASSRMVMPARSARRRTASTKSRCSMARTKLMASPLAWHPKQ